MADRLHVWRPTPYCACSFYQAFDASGVMRPIDHLEAIALHIAGWKDPEKRRRKIREKEALTPSARAQVRAHLAALGVTDYSPEDIAEARAEKHIGIHEPIPEGWENAGTEAIYQSPREAPQRRLVICDAHAGVPDVQARHLAVRNEFVREQTARQILINVVGADFKDEDYSFTMLPDTIPGVPGARKVRVDYKGLNVSQRNQVKALADLQFGVGQVEV